MKGASLKHARHVVLCQREVGIHAPINAIEEVNMPFALEQPSKLQAVFKIGSVFNALINDEADADDNVVANSLADRFMDHQAETCPVLDRTTKTVSALVGTRR